MRMFNLIALTITFLIYNCKVVTADLKLLNVVFRHGDRAPDNNGRELYPNDPYKDNSFWPYTPGGLTNNGKFREYQLGKYLRKQYGDFLGEYYLPENIYSRSTNYHRTKMSLQLVLAGLYPPKDEQLWTSDLRWQPIPVNDVANLNDDYLMRPRALCPKYLEARDKVEASPEFQAELSKFNDVMEYLTNVTGKNISQAIDMFNLYHTLKAEQFLGLEIPKYFDGIFPDGELLNGTLLQYKFYSYNNEMKKLNGGMLLHRFISNMLDYIHGGINKLRKIFLYSGHETNVAAVLQTLGVYQPVHIPEYSSAVIIELHEENNEYYVKVVYNKGIVKSGPIDEIKRIHGCDIHCPLDKFRSLLRDVTPSDEDTKCKKLPLQNH